MFKNIGLLISLVLTAGFLSLVLSGCPGSPDSAGPGMGTKSSSSSADKGFTNTIVTNTYSIGNTNFMIINATNITGTNYLSNFTYDITNNYVLVYHSLVSNFTLNLDWMCQTNEFLNSFLFYSSTNHYPVQMPISNINSAYAYSLSNTWTIMVYMNGDNDLESFALQNFNEMESGLTNPQVNVVVLFGRAVGWDTSDGNWWGGRLYSITHDPNGVDNTIRSLRLTGTINGIDLSKNNAVIDMGVPQTLSDFIDYSKARFPASNYMLVMWDHGDGWRGLPSVHQSGVYPNMVSQLSASAVIQSISTAQSSSAIRMDAYRAISWDQGSGNILYNSQVRQVLAGKGIAVLGFDACLMNMIECVYEFQNSAQYMVGSADLEPGPGWDYQAMLGQFGASPLTAADLYKAVVDAYSNRYYNDMPMQATELSAIDLSKVGPLMTAFNAYAADLHNDLINAGHADHSSNQIYAITHTIEEYIDPLNGGNFHLDIWDMADKLVYGTSAALKNAVSNAVVYEWHYPGGDIFNNDPNAHGLAVYFGTFDSSMNIYPWPEYIYSNVILFTSNSIWPQYLIDVYNYPAAPWIFTNQTITGSMASNGSLSYSIYAGTPGTFTIDMQPPAGCDDDITLQYYTDPNINIAASANRGFGAAEHISYTVPAGNIGWYNINVKRYSVLAAGNTNETFSLVVSNGTAALK